MGRTNKSSHGGGLAGAVVAEEGGDLARVEVQVEVLHSHLVRE